MAQVLTLGDDGCPAALANGANGQVLQIVGDEPTYVDFDADECCVSIASASGAPAGTPGAR